MSQDRKAFEQEEGSEVIDFNQKRAQRLDEKRRKTERIFFKQMLGIYCVTDNSELKSVELMDVSEDGLSFQVPFDSANPWPKNTGEIPLRLYFSQDTYLPVTLKIQNSRHHIEESTRYIRYGCAVDKSISSYEAYKQFVKFVSFYAEHAHKDTGKVTLFYL